MNIYKYLPIVTVGPFGTVTEHTDSDDVKTLGVIDDWHYVAADVPPGPEEIEFILVTDSGEIDCIPTIMANMAAAKRLRNSIKSCKYITTPDGNTWDYEAGPNGSRELIDRTLAYKINNNISDDASTPWKLADDSWVQATATTLIGVTNAWTEMQERLFLEYAAWAAGDCLEPFVFSG